MRPDTNYSFVYPFPKPILEKIAYRFEAMGRNSQDLTYLSQIRKTVAAWQNCFNSDFCTLTWEQRGPDVVIMDRREGYIPADYRLKGHSVDVFHALHAPHSLSSVTNSLGQTAATHLIVGHKTRNQNCFRKEMDKKGRGRVCLEQYPNKPTTTDWTDHRLEVANGSPNDIVIGFSKAAFAKDPEQCLESLIENGIIFREDRSYLALPVHSRILEFRHGWSNAGI